MCVQVTFHQPTTKPPLSIPFRREPNSWPLPPALDAKRTPSRPSFPLPPPPHQTPPWCPPFAFLHRPAPLPNAQAFAKPVIGHMNDDHSESTIAMVMHYIGLNKVRPSLGWGWGESTVAWVRT